MPETYRLIAETETDAEAPITADLMKALQKNLLASFEGATGAPKLQGKAVGRDFNDGLEVITVAAGAVTSAQGEGRVNGIGTFSQNTNVDVLAAQWVIKAYTGSLRFGFTHAGGASPSRSAVTSLYKNGVLVSSFSDQNSTARTIDSTVVPGDVMELRFRSSVNGLTVTISSASINVSADDPYAEQPTYRRNSEVLT